MADGAGEIDWILEHNHTINIMIIHSYVGMVCVAEFINWG